MRAAIGLGSNLPSKFGGREDNLREAIARVGALGSVVAVSGFYDTEPVGFTEQPRFLNAVAVVETLLEPGELLRGLLRIEQEMGRRRDLVVAKGPRVIDLDLLLVDDFVVATKELTLPHPAMAERRFVLEPLAEVWGEWRHPGTGTTVREMLELDL